MLPFSSLFMSKLLQGGSSSVSLWNKKVNTKVESVYETLYNGLSLD